MNMLTLEKEDLFMLLDRWNGLTAGLMVDPKLLEVPIETLDGHVIAFSTESGWVYLHSIQVPTDADLQQYPHVFFTPPDIWDASVLDHGITPALLEESRQNVDGSLLKDSMFDELGDLLQQGAQHFDVSGIQALQSLGSILFMPISTRPTLLRKIRNP